MVNFKKIDELREGEAEIRKGILGWIRGIDPVIWAGILAGAILFFIVVSIVIYRG